ncbi:MAG: DNA helicase UvrBC [Clostridiaceae bacterium]|nr:DNA helicase UvrBC [Clostridiaceae bacterium]
MTFCQICRKREAKVHYTRIINGQKTDLHVCNECAGAYGVKIDLNSLITGLLGIDGDQMVKQRAVVRCDRCGMTVEDFNRTGKMGCGTCYEVFQESMQELLTRIHGNTRHRGKIPIKFELKQKNDLRIEELKKQLEECIRTENYERAAQIRDEIKFLTGERGGRSYE